MPLISTYANIASRGIKNSQDFVELRDWANGTQSKTTGNQITDSVTAQAGDLIIAFMSWEPTGSSTPTISAITDTAGTTYVSMGALVPAPATTTSTAGTLTQAYWGIVPSGVASGTITTTVTFTANCANRICQTVAFYNAKQALVNARTITVGTGTSGTLTSGIANTGDLVICFVGSENNAIPTGAVDTNRGSWSTVIGGASSGGQASTNQAWAGQYKIVTGQGTQTASFASIATNWAIHTYVIKAA